METEARPTADVLALTAKHLRQALGPVRIFVLRNDPYEPETVGPGPVLVVVTRAPQTHVTYLVNEVEDAPLTYAVDPETYEAGATAPVRAARAEGIEL